MSRHFWPTEPGSYLVEHENHAVHTWYLESDGEWTQNRMMGGLSVGQMERGGWLGVRTPFSEEDERAAFEEHFKGFDFSRYDDGTYRDKYKRGMLEGWLAAKRHERGM